MSVDWGFAGQIGGIGFGLVFAVLIILALVIWITGMALKKAVAGKPETGEEKKGE